MGDRRWADTNVFVKIRTKPTWIFSFYAIDDEPFKYLFVHWVDRGTGSKGVGDQRQVNIRVLECRIKTFEKKK